MQGSLICVWSRFCISQNPARKQCNLSRLFSKGNLIGHTGEASSAAKWGGAAIQRIARAAWCFLHRVRSTVGEVVFQILKFGDFWKDLEPSWGISSES